MIELRFAYLLLSNKGGYWQVGSMKNSHFNRTQLYLKYIEHQLYILDAMPFLPKFLDGQLRSEKHLNRSVVIESISFSFCWP